MLASFAIVGGLLSSIVSYPRYVRAKTQESSNLLDPEYRTLRDRSRSVTLWMQLSLGLTAAGVIGLLWIRERPAT